MLQDHHWILIPCLPTLFAILLNFQIIFPDYPLKNVPLTSITENQDEVKHNKLTIQTRQRSVYDI
jgi:hypothetical protein